MKIKYTFANGEETTVEVCGDFEEIILELDRNLYNNNQTETRRHVSLTNFDQDREIFKDIGVDLENQFLTQVDIEILYKSISKLSFDDRQLINKIYLSEDKISMTEYANSMGIKSAALWKRLERIRKKLKCILNE